MALTIMTDIDALANTGGVDTHKDTHVAAVLDPLGTVIATKAFLNDTGGYAELWAWMASFGRLGRVGVEGTGSYGARLARFLRQAGVEVIEVNRPDRAARRRDGKSDTTDAIAAARAVLSGTATVVPKTGDGIVESIRALQVARRSAVRSRTLTGNQIHALRDTAPTELVEQCRTETIAELAEHRPRRRLDYTDPSAATRAALTALATRYVTLDAEITELGEHLDAATATAAPLTRAAYGVGPITAAALLIAAGDNPHRLHSEAAFAALCGVSPIEASSGRTTRHRLNRGGNRDANAALWRIVMVRLSHDSTTKTYAARRRSEGCSDRDIIRCLKRYVARQLYPRITADLAPR